MGRGSGKDLNSRCGGHWKLQKVFFNESVSTILQLVVADNGRGSEWHSLLGVGKLPACRSVKTHLANIREEQLKARVTPLQAEPILVGDLAFISNHIEHMLLHHANSAIQIFVQARDQAPVVQTMDSAIRRINHYPLDNSIGLASVYPLDSGLSDE